MAGRAGSPRTGLRALRRRGRDARPAGGGLAPPERPGFFDAPSLVVCPAQVRIGDTWAATLAVSGYPREVGPGWLTPLTGHPGMVDVSVHLTPLDSEVSAARLRRRLARLESGRRIGAERGRLDDADVDAATEDAHVLMAQLARGTTRLFETTLTLTVHAGSRAELAEEVASIRSVAASLMITVRATTWRALHGWHTGLPAGVDRIESGRILDTATLAAGFPFASADLPATRPRADGGVLYGLNLGSSGLVWWDRWTAANHHEVVLGSSGGGKSFFVKSTLLRELYRGVQAQVIDPHNEYPRLAAAVGGTVVRLGAPAVKINPLELPVHHDPVTGRRSAAPDAVTRRRLFLQSFLSVALSTDTHTDSAIGAGTGPGISAGERVGLSALERAVLDSAITAVYAEAGITDDPRSWTRPAPVLADLLAVLRRDATGEPRTAAASSEVPGRAPHTGPCPSAADGSAGSAGEALTQVAAGLAARLTPFTEGAHAGLFDGPTTTPPSGHLVVWSLADLPAQLHPLGMLLVLDAVWRAVTHPERRPRLVVIDEAWTMLQHPAAARFLLRAAKGLRKHWAGMSVITQDVADVLGSELGRAVITNSATAVLLGQSAQAIPDVSKVFDLSAGEAQFLGSAARGDALLVSARQRVALRAVASAAEDSLITTDPAQLAAAGDHGPRWIDLDQSTVTGRDRARPPRRPGPPIGHCRPGPSGPPGHDYPADLDDLSVPGW